MDDQLRDLITDVVRRGSVYLEERTVLRTNVFLDSLSKLQLVFSDLYPTVFLKPATYPITPLLKLCYELLEHVSTDNFVRQRVYNLLHRLVHVNLSLRQFCATQLPFPQLVYKTLKYNLKARQNSELVVEAFKLLQFLTYETDFKVEGYGMDFLSVLCDEIIDPQTTEYLSYSLSLLCNLVSKSKEMSHAFMLEFYQSLSRKFLSFLASDNYLVVISTLLILRRLNTPMSEKFFTSMNMFQTLLCAFNVLAQADSTLTVNFASDFLRSVLVTKTRDNEIELSDLCREFSTFQYFSKAIENSAIRIVTFDPRTEETSQILSLLYDLVRVKSLKSPVCQIILNANSPQGQSTSNGSSTPMKSLVRMVALGLEKQPNPEVTVKAIKLLNLLVKEIVDDGAEISTFENPAVLVAVVEMNAQVSMNAESSQTSYYVDFIAQTLILAQTLTNDKEACDMLADAMSPELCARINDTQFAQNGDLFQMCQSTNSSIDSNGGRLNGMMIPIEMIKLLGLLKDHSRIHKDIYWRTLEDDRIIPFIAYSLTRGTQEQIRSALTVVPQCAQKLAFPWDLLAKNMANCTANSLKNEANSSKSSVEDDEKQVLLQTVVDLRKELDTERLNSSDLRKELRERDEMVSAVKSRNAELEYKMDKVLKELDQVKAVQNQVASLIRDTSNGFDGLSISNRLFDERNGKL
ncbi:unnamed protein product [Bursaphelenchus xylophilus]|uniref:(pine wood nematode) hypothetical protein n=1 Tax=Bursaphelenchus xylophilus TaxID=6326 RepID=A0A1I7RYW3_BURXY|nr:unnamed protein product [Bursaphelenchus xylophilus]CAG9092141.1 unnamed protein product [Bursaphelenchus xylophilus]